MRPEDHRLVSRGLLSDDKRWSRRPIFLSHFKTNTGFFYLLTTKNRILDWKKKHEKGFQRILNTLRCDMVTSFYHCSHCDVTERRAASVRPTYGCSFFYVSLGLVRVCEIELSHMGKKRKSWSGVCKKKLSLGFPKQRESNQFPRL